MSKSRDDVAALVLARGSQSDTTLQSAIHVVARQGNGALLKLLVAHGADVNARTASPSAVYCLILKALPPQNTSLEDEVTYEYRPLHAASLLGHLDVVTGLLELGADIEAAVDASDGVTGCTALRLAVSVLSMDPKNIISVRHLSRFIFHRWSLPNLNATSTADKLAVVAALVAAGADMVACGAVHLAAALGSFDVFELLLEAGADPDAPYQGEIEIMTPEGYFLPLGLSAREYLNIYCDNWKRSNHRFFRNNWSDNTRRLHRSGILIDFPAEAAKVVDLLSVEE